MAVSLQPQVRNSELIAILRTDFQHLTDPPRLTIYATGTLSSPPTTAQINTVLGVSAVTDVPGRCVFLLKDGTTNWWLVIADPGNSNYKVVALTVTT